MNRKIILLVAILAVTYTVQAQGISTNIGDSCAADEASLVSIYDRDGGHVAEPGFYDNEVCVSGEIDYNIRDDQCLDGVHMFSLFNRTNSHLSMYSSYNYDICGKRTRGWAAESCGVNGTAVLSIKTDDNTHVAEPNHPDFDQNLCISIVEPQNITVELSGVSAETTFIDGEESSPQEEPYTLLEYPYIVSEGGDYTKGIVGHGDFVRLSHPESGTFSMTMTDGSFILPHTEGGVDRIERRKDLVLDRTFLQQLSPSFGFFIPEQPTIRVILQPERETSGFTDILQRELSVSVTNAGLTDGEVAISIGGENR